MGARTADGRVIHTQISGGIDGLHAVAVAGGGGEARITITVRGGGGDLGKGGAARPLTALDAIAGDADVVGGGGPVEIDLTAAGGGGGQAGDRARGRRVG